MSDPRSSPDVRAVLRARAKKLAHTRRQDSADEAMLEVLEFRLAQERYAVESSYVREVYPLRNLTVLPTTPAFVAGIVNVRGRIVPVLDLKKFFHLPETGITDLHRVIVLSTPALEFGLLADVSVGVLTISESRLQPPLPTLTEIGSEYLKGVTGDRLIVLDASRIMSDPRIVVSEEVEI